MAFVDAGLRQQVRWGEAHKPINISIPSESWRIKVKQDITSNQVATELDIRKVNADAANDFVTS
jgi:hypothetical protein